MRRLLIGMMLTVAPMTVDAASLTVAVHNIDDEGGDVRVVLYNTEPTWLTHHGLAVKSAPSKPGDMSFTFDDVASGTYAILAYHDANRNQDLDRNFLGIPTEQFGFSNNPGYNHKPDFSEATFAIGADPVSLDIKLSD